MSKIKNYYFEAMELAENMKYLKGLSYDTKLMVTQRICCGRTNLYHSVMSVINCSIRDADDLKSLDVYKMEEKYFSQFSERHNFKEDERQNIYELFEFCFEKKLRKKKGDIL